MSTTPEEARALERVRLFLLRLGSGAYRVDSITELRQDARNLVKHFPLAAGDRWREMSEEHDRIIDILSEHPDPCERYEGDDAVSCGWKSAYRDVVSVMSDD